jgi:hypothetical protein
MKSRRKNSIAQNRVMAGCAISSIEFSDAATVIEDLEWAVVVCLKGTDRRSPGETTNATLNFI